MKRRESISLMLAASSVSMLHSRKAWSQKDTSSIRVGLTMPFAGPVKQQGIEFYRGAGLYIDFINKGGGVGGRPIELSFLDDSFDSAKVRQNAEDLVSENIVAMMGCLGKSAGLAALTVLQEAGVPLFAPLSGDQALREPFNRYVFHVRASMVDEALMIAKHLSILGITRYAIIHRAEGDDGGAITEMLNRLPASMPRPLATASIDVAGNSVEKAVETVTSKQVQAVLFVGPSYKATSTFIRAAHTRGLRATFYCTSDVGTKALADEIKDVAAGVTVTQVMPYPFSPTTRISREYLQLLRQAANAAQYIASYTGIEGFVAAKVLVEALRRAGPQITPEKLILAIESIRGWDIGGMAFDFSSANHVGSKYVDITVLTAAGKILR